MSEKFVQEHTPVFASVTDVSYGTHKQRIGEKKHAHPTISQMQHYEYNTKGTETVRRN